jgi:hypothetical protein
VLPEGFEDDSISPSSKKPEREGLPTRLSHARRRALRGVAEFEARPDRRRADPSAIVKPWNPTPTFETAAAIVNMWNV